MSSRSDALFEAMGSIDFDTYIAELKKKLETSAKLPSGLFYF